MKLYEVRIGMNVVLNADEDGQIYSVIWIDRYKVGITRLVDGQELDTQAVEVSQLENPTIGQLLAGLQK
jgi:hypothetical protein